MMETNEIANQLNLELLKELAEVMGDDMNMLIDSYFEDSEPKLKSLIAMDLETEQDAIYKLAHSLKGSSRNVGVIGFSDYCETVEKLAREGSLTGEDFNVNELTKRFTDARDALKSHFNL